ncbi:MAG: DUF3108 domain-containing protein [Candidatus Omnitrophica bacterium]|nr:DUF3108 domain-containing protein [Candidatus Omnitrophota bacterium]
MKQKSRRNNVFLILLTFSLLSIIFSGCAVAKTTNRIKIDGRLKVAKDIQIQETKKLFNIGEKITFKITWLGVPVGTVISEIKGIEIIRGKESYRIELTAETNPVMSAVFPVRDKFISFMDIKTLGTLRHEVNRKEGFYRKQAFTDFYPEQNYAYFKNSLDGSEKTFKIPDTPQDTLTAFYYLRTLNISLGDTVTYNIINSEKIYTIYANIVKKEFIKLKNLGTFDAFLIKPKAELEGKETTRGSAIGYFSADSKRLPLISILRSYLFTKIIITLTRYEQGNTQ